MAWLSPLVVALAVPQAVVPSEFSGHWCLVLFMWLSALTFVGPLRLFADVLDGARSTGVLSAQAQPTGSRAAVERRARSDSEERQRGEQYVVGFV